MSDVHFHKFQSLFAIASSNCLIQFKLQIAFRTQPAILPLMINFSLR